jgi:isocitrate/isopropylmalate dehydrogenase
LKEKKREKNNYEIKDSLLAGDGIGPEVINEAESLGCH